MNHKHLIVSLAGLGLLVGCNTDRMEKEELEENLETVTQYSRSIDDIVDDPAGNTGQTVSIKGDVEKKLFNGFVLQESGLGGDEVLVVGDKTTYYAEGSSVMVTGTVQNALLSTIEKDYEVEGFDSSELEIEVDTEPLPYVMASNIEVID